LGINKIKMRLEFMAPVYRLRGGRVGLVVILVGPTCRLGHFFGPYVQFCA
jgi:hypothetical protein